MMGTMAMSPAQEALANHIERNSHLRGGAPMSEMSDPELRSQTVQRVMEKAWDSDPAVNHILGAVCSEMRLSPREAIASVLNKAAEPVPVGR